jgi:NAD+ synthase (glutamine-hydrolysing)
MHDTIRYALAQLNPTVGAIDANTKKTTRIAQQASKQGADIVIFPELVISGYPPEDLLLRNDFLDAIDQAIEHLKTALPHDMHCVIGAPIRTDHGLSNCAIVFYQGEVIARYAKRHLPNYGVFDEKRYFTAGSKACTFHVKQHCIGLCICEDVWQAELVSELKTLGAQSIISINASPFEQNKAAQRKQMLEPLLKQQQLEHIYVNCVGGQDELVFDGGSFAHSADGTITQQAPYFKESLLLFPAKQTVEATPLNHLTAIRQALVLGIKDYVHKNGFKRALLGLSGGIDSALTLCLAVEALGKDNVTAVMMPSRYTSAISEEDAQQLLRRLGVPHHTLCIEAMFKATQNTLASTFAGKRHDHTEENMQARCRGLLLMALSNKTDALVLTTGNRSEMAVGYATLYGDMAGGYAVLKDVYKTTVWDLARHINQQAQTPIIPQRIIDRPPTAELADNQKDEDSLPPYPVLDEILKAYLDEEQSIKQMVQGGLDATLVRKVIHMIQGNEYKRYQSPPGPRICHKAFGKDRRFPLINQFQHNP